MIFRFVVICHVTYVLPIDWAFFMYLKVTCPAGEWQIKAVQVDWEIGNTLITSELCLALPPPPALVRPGQWSSPLTNLIQHAPRPFFSVEQRGENNMSRDIAPPPTTTTTTTTQLQVTVNNAGPLTLRTERWWWVGSVSARKTYKDVWSTLTML